MCTNLQDIVSSNMKEGFLRDDGVSRLNSAQKVVRSLSANAKADSGLSIWKNNNNKSNTTIIMPLISEMGVIGDTNRYHCSTEP